MGGDTSLPVSVEKRQKVGLEHCQSLIVSMFVVVDLYTSEEKNSDANNKAEYTDMSDVWFRRVDCVEAHRTRVGAEMIVYSGMHMEWATWYDCASCPHYCLLHFPTVTQG